jgi:hypothetical protein
MKVGEEEVVKVGEEEVPKMRVREGSLVKQENDGSCRTSDNIDLI